ncbi:MAG: hypothetical protein ACKO23_12970, partial [Gemmataceae bacterium]
MPFTRKKGVVSDRKNKKISGIVSTQNHEKDSGCAKSAQECSHLVARDDPDSGVSRRPQGDFRGSLISLGAVAG